jgi:hypothetical protein
MHPTIQSFLVFLEYLLESIFKGDLRGFILEAIDKIYSAQ